MLNAGKTLPNGGCDALVRRTQGPVDFGELCALGMCAEARKSPGPASLLDLLASQLLNDGNSIHDGEAGVRRPASHLALTVCWTCWPGSSCMRATVAVTVSCGQHLRSDALRRVAWSAD